MKFIDETKKVLTRSYTAWLTYLGMAAALAFEFGLHTTLPVWAVVVLLALILLGRVVKQDAVSGTKEEDKSTEDPLFV